MTARPEPRTQPIDMNDAEAMTAERDRLTENLDPVDLMGALLTVADACDLDLIDILDQMIAGARKFNGPEAAICDLIDISQSAGFRDLDLIREFVILDNAIMELPMQT